jgi:hypothetical protein
VLLVDTDPPEPGEIVEGFSKEFRLVQERQYPLMRGQGE